MFRARIARVSDYKAVARLCRRTEGTTDYVLPILRQVIASRGLFLAYHGKDLVGITNFERCIDGSGWLGMARTDPEWRRKGVAVYLQKVITKHSLRLGIKTLRFWVHSTNKPALKAAAKGGFRPVCEAFHISLHVRTRRKADKSLPIVLKSHNIIRSILKSEYLHMMNGYFACTWHFVKADERLLGHLIQRGELYSLDDTLFVLSGPEKWSNTSYSSFTLLAGAASPSLPRLRRALRVMRTGIVGSYLPYDSRLAAAAKTAGFHLDEWGRHCIVFEKTFS